MHLSRVVASAAVAVLVACGGDSAPTNPADGGQGSNPPPGTVGVSIRDFSFSPASLTVTAGTLVRWTNTGPSAHTTTSDTGVWSSVELGAPNSGGGYGDGGTAAGTFEFTFIQPGTYTYHCSLHPPSSYPGFTGTVTVNP